MKNNRKTKNEALINLGIAIRKLRIRKGYKSAELFSYENNLNRTAYWRWENGQNLTMKNFFKLCSIHNLTPKDFFNSMEGNKFDRASLTILNEPQENIRISPNNQIKPSNSENKF